MVVSVGVRPLSEVGSREGGECIPEHHQAELVQPVVPPAAELVVDLAETAFAADAHQNRHHQTSHPRDGPATLHHTRPVQQLLLRDRLHSPKRQVLLQNRVQPIRNVRLRK